MSEKKEERDKKSEDKKDIEMEEREKMLNAENNAHNKDIIEEKSEEKKVTTDMKEGMEVKPKKIPIGGIQMPGFFTRSKSKERCKEDDSAEVDEVDLIRKSTENNEISQTTIRLPNPFRKSKVEDDEDKTSERKEKKKLLNTIRLPLVSVFPKKKKDDKLENQAQAGLASMETLDDKSTDEKSNDGKNMKNVDLDDKSDVENQDNSKALPFTVRMRDYKVAIGIALLLVITVIIIIILMTVTGKNTEKFRPLRDGKFITTHTGCGQVEGIMEDGAYAFKGIPYARPPIGNLRFKYAQQLNNLQYCWNGTLLAHNATPACLQILSNGSVVGQEDCLTLDVITPSVTYDNPVPVVVLIGADSLMGGSPGRMVGSAKVSRVKEVIFVRPNFRLGALGFLALQALSESDYPKTSGNYGLSDILAALRWIQLNIEHFGGDKKSVTLFGHKAGATLVTALTTMKDAKKYFTRAWASSGGSVYPKKTANEAEIDNQSFMETLQCEDAACLRGLDSDKLVTAVEDTWRKSQPDLPSEDEKPESRHQWLVLDGRILREYPEDVWGREDGLSVPLVLGSTAQSGATEKLLMKHTQWTEPLVNEHISRSLLSNRNLSGLVPKMYPSTYKGLTSLISDIRIVCPLFSLSNQMSKVPFYVVTQPRSSMGYADMDSDVDVILGNYRDSGTEESHYVSSLQSLFYDFVFRGVIDKEVTGQKVLLVGPTVVPNSTYSHCTFWILKNIVPLYAALD